MKDETIAVTEARPLLFTIAFWISIKGLLLIIGFGGLFILSLTGFTYPTGGQLVGASAIEKILSWGSIFIHPCLIIGIWWVLGLMLDVYIESATARCIHGNVQMQLDQIAKPGGARPDIKTLYRICVPNRPGHPTNVSELFKRIQKDAENRKFESAMLLAIPFQERIEIKLNYLTGIQRYALSLGILGTFIGLLLAIGGVEKSFGALTGYQDMEDLLLNFNNLSGGLFNALRIAFRTSVAGLQVSVIMVLMIMYARRAIDRYFDDIENMISISLSLALKATNKDEFFNDLRDASTRMNEVEDSIGQHRRQIDFNMKRVETRLETQTNHIQEGIGRLIETKDKLAEFIVQSADNQDSFNKQMAQTYHSFQKQTDKHFHRLSRTQHDFVEDVKKVYDLTSMKNIGERLETNVNESVGKLTKGLQLSLKRIVNDVGEIDKNLNLLQASTYDALKENMEHISSQVSSIHGTLKQLENTASENSRLIMEQQMEKMDNLLRSLTGLTKSTEGLSSLMQESILKNLNQIDNHLSNFQQSFSHQLNPQLSKIQKSTRTFSELVEKINEESRYMPLLMKEIAESTKSMGVSFKSWQKQDAYRSNSYILFAGKFAIGAGLLTIATIAVVTGIKFLF